MSRKRVRFASMRIQFLPPNPNPLRRWARFCIGSSTMRPVKSIQSDRNFVVFPMPNTKSMVIVVCATKSRKNRIKKHSTKRWLFVPHNWKSYTGWIDMQSIREQECQPNRFLWFATHPYLWPDASDFAVALWTAKDKKVLRIRVTSQWVSDWVQFLPCSR